MSDLAIKIEHVTKEYRLGAIGGGTLRGDLQTWMARVQGKEDPNAKIGTSNSQIKVGEKFLALDDVNLEVKKGEALGIIGHNGAGKSTLLKLLCRVTAPTKGKISYNGRIASMLEVGTGFHAELTGRENVYMNGAILGMTKAEIDRKFDQIVEFAEMEQFIDTPVKRYSSGMYVKLAFSVAAHLDSEIMIMDEVLAVGDMAFQKKCLGKMRSAAKEEGRTVLYVSHNMNTIRQLCDRCVVMNHGQLVYDGDVDKAIAKYMGVGMLADINDIAVTDDMRDVYYVNPDYKITRIQVESKNILNYGEKVRFKIWIDNQTADNKDVLIRVLIKTLDGKAVSMSYLSNPVDLKQESQTVKEYTLDTSRIVPGQYMLSFVLYEVGEFGADRNIDVVRDIYSFTISPVIGFNLDMPWNSQWWGNVFVGELSEC